MNASSFLIEALESRNLFSTVTQIGEYALGPSGNTSGGRQVDADANGNFVVVREQGDANQDLFARRFDANGNFLGEVTVDTSVNSKYTPNVAAAANGNFAVVWYGYSNGFVWNIFAREFNAAGQPLTPEIRVTDDKNQGNYEARVGIDAVGNFVVVWDQFVGKGSAVAQRYSPSGAKLGKQITIASGYHPHWVDMDDNGNFVVAWRDVGVMAQRIRADGVKLGSPFQVNATIGDQSPQVSLNATNGDFTIGWAEPGAGGVWAQCYNSAGNALAGKFRLDGDPAGAGLSSLDVGRDGNFAISWGDSFGSHARVFAAGGTPISDPFDANVAQIMMQPGGKFLTVWGAPNYAGLFATQFLIVF